MAGGESWRSVLAGLPGSEGDWGLDCLRLAVQQFGLLVSEVGNSASDSGATATLQIEVPLQGSCYSSASRYMCLLGGYLLVRSWDSLGKAEGEEVQASASHHTHYSIC